MGSKHSPPRWWLQGEYEEEFLRADRKVSERFIYPHEIPSAMVKVIDSAPVGLQWRTWQYIGFELRDPDTRQVIAATEELPIGRTVLVYSLPADRYVPARVTSMATAETEYSLFSLERDRDDRHAWTCGAEMNKAAVHKITFTLEV